jgi:hypothetical protein
MNSLFLLSAFLQKSAKFISVSCYVRRSVKIRWNSFISLWEDPPWGYTVITRRISHSGLHFLFLVTSGLVLRPHPPQTAYNWYRGYGGSTHLHPVPRSTRRSIPCRNMYIFKAQCPHRGDTSSGLTLQRSGDARSEPQLGHRISWLRL